MDLLANDPSADSLKPDLAERANFFIVPHVLDVEVASALQNCHRAGKAVYLVTPRQSRTLRNIAKTN